MNLILINGTMGSGKTATSQILKQKLPNSVFLDGDWCWDMHPFTVNERRKQLVLDNIHALLNNFIQSREYDNIIFCWVMHQESILRDVLSGLALSGVDVHCYTLICSEQALRARMAKDVAAGVRKEEDIARSVARIPLYQQMPTHHIDVSAIGANEAAEIINSGITSAEKKW